MSKRDKAARKKKRREERIRQEKHARRAQPLEREDDEEEDVAGSIAQERALRRFELVRERPEHRAAARSALASRALEKRSDALALELIAADPREQAQELAFQALESDDALTARTLAGQALALDAECADALAVLALGHGDAPAQCAALAAAVAAAKHRLGEPFIAEKRGRLHAVVRAWPLLRLTEQLAFAWRAGGERGEARAALEEVLALDASDDTGLRWELLGWQLEDGEHAAARRLIAAWPSDADDADLGAELAWARVLMLLLAGEPAGAVEERIRAERLNALALPALLGREPDQAQVRRAPHHAEEAWLISERLGPAWRAHPEAWRWLGAPAAPPAGA
jgi:hypothetical protein